MCLLQMAHLRPDRHQDGVEILPGPDVETGQYGQVSGLFNTVFRIRSVSDRIRIPDLKKTDPDPGSGSRISDPVPGSGSFKFCESIWLVKGPAKLDSTL